MRLIKLCVSLTGAVFFTSGCTLKGDNPADPYESINRKVHRFNTSLDNALLKPAAKVYKAAVPAVVRKGVNNAFNNLDMIPTVANDLLQGEVKWAIRDTGRFTINSTLGVGGLFDVVETHGYPPHYNDLGLTFAKWGDKQSPYLVLPFLGPSTIRDGYGMLFQFVMWSPYVYINNDALAYGLVGLRFVDLRAQFLDSEAVMNEALDQYTFLRDAYLQRRSFMMTGKEQNNGELYVSEKEGDDGKTTLSSDSQPSDYVEELADS